MLLGGHAQGTVFLYVVNDENVSCFFYIDVDRFLFAA